MINIYLAQVMVDDDPRQAEKEHLIEIINRSRKIRNRQKLAKLACRFGLTQTSDCEKAIQCQDTI